MDAGIWVALITGAFTFAGVVITVLQGNKKTAKQIKEQSDVTLYRIEQLEIKQDKHNTLIERMYRAEDKINLLDERTNSNTRRIDNLESKGV